LNTPFAEPGSAPGVPCSVDFYDPALFALDGRIGRVRYFAYCCAMSCLCLLAAGVIVLACAGVAMMLLLGLLYLMTVGASLILFVRRLHDLDRSGWMSLLLLIPLVNVALSLYATFAPGTSGSNRFGQAPKPNSQKLVAAAVAAPFFIVMLSFAPAMIPSLRNLDHSGMARQPVASEVVAEANAAGPT
jgi:uncharacterized membrane protein YhaH (DUF805 family)